VKNIGERYCSDAGEVIFGKKNLEQQDTKKGRKKCV
jgi:hypothetical protein